MGARTRGGPRSAEESRGGGLQDPKGHLGVPGDATRRRAGGGAHRADQPPPLRPARRHQGALGRAHRPAGGPDLRTDPARLLRLRRQPPDRRARVHQPGLQPERHRRHRDRRRGDDRPWGPPPLVRAPGVTGRAAPLRHGRADPHRAQRVDRCWRHGAAGGHGRRRLGGRRRCRRHAATSRPRHWWPACRRPWSGASPTSDPPDPASSPATTTVRSRCRSAARTCPCSQRGSFRSPSPRSHGL